MLPNEASGMETRRTISDEITSAAPSVSAAAYQLILDRRLGEYEVPEGWANVAAGNRQGDRGVTTRCRRRLPTGSATLRSTQI